MCCLIGPPIPHDVAANAAAIVHGARRGVAHMVSVERLGFPTHREPNDHGPRGGITWWYHVDQQHTPHLFSRVAEHERALFRSLSLSATHSNPRTRIESPFSLPRAFWPSPSPLRTGGGSWVELDLPSNVGTNICTDEGSRVPEPVCSRHGFGCASERWAQIGG